MDKNKISDTDSFWNQLSEKDQPMTEDRPSSTPLAAEQKDGSIAIDKDQLLRTVARFRESGDGLADRETEMVSLPRERETAPGRKGKAENKSNARRKERGERKERRAENDSVTMSRNTVIAIVAAAVVCLSSFAGIFWKLSADKAEIIGYIETELAAIRTANDAAIAEMGDTLGRMETNFDEIVSLLEETGAAIGSSSQESRAAISERIEKLDKQLQSLQKSLAVLQEDANGRKK